MRRTTLLTAAVLLAAAAFFTLRGFSITPNPPPGDPAQRAAAEGKFIVREWGTFTSFSGSDGVKLEFRPLVDADLPLFVLNRPRQAGLFNPFMKSAIPVVQRMETPVTYFYSDRPRSVNVRVGFPRGLLTEFFPPVAAMQPECTYATDPIENSSLDWGRVWIVPEDRFHADVGDPAIAARMQERMLRRLIPSADGYDHYAYARQTDSALVYVEREADEKRPYAPRGGWFEKFLFYRGIGNFELPLELTADAAGRFELTNLGPHPIRSLFLVTMEGDQLRYAAFDEIGPGKRLALRQSGDPSSADDLAAALQAVLVRAGLYDKEAAAMVATWRSSWFGEQGTRLFYLLPEPLTDELLPLTIDPPPEERLRVMVGRLEIMSPADEARVADLVRNSSRDRAATASENGASTYALPEWITQLGRLAEPALVRIQNIAADAAVRQEAALLLCELLASRP